MNPSTWIKAPILDLFCFFQTILWVVSPIFIQDKRLCWKISHLEFFHTGHEDDERDEGWGEGCWWQQLGFSGPFWNHLCLEHRTLKMDTETALLIGCKNHGFLMMFPQLTCARVYFIPFLSYSEPLWWLSVGVHNLIGMNSCIMARIGSAGKGIIECYNL